MSPSQLSSNFTDIIPPQFFHRNCSVKIGLKNTYSDRKSVCEKMNISEKTCAWKNKIRVHHPFQLKIKKKKKKKKN